MRLFTLSLLVLGFLVGSCSSEPPVTIKKGQEFTFDGQKITVDYKASTVLVNEKEHQTLVAPEGKIYLLVDVKAANGNYFSSLMDGQTELEQLGFYVSGPFVRDLDIASTPDRSELFLVDIASSKLSIKIKSYGDESATLELGTLKDEATVKVGERMKAYLQEFKEGGRLLEAAKKYVKEGVNPMDIATDETGEPIFGDPVIKGLEIKDITPEGSYYCTTIFGFEYVEITWDGDYITKIVGKY